MTALAALIAFICRYPPSPTVPTVSVAPYRRCRWRWRRQLLGLALDDCNPYLSERDRLNIPGTPQRDRLLGAQLAAAPSAPVAPASCSL